MVWAHGIPGGHLEPNDDSLQAAAARETLEEIGLDLGKYGSYVGSVDQQRAAPRGRTIDMIIAPEVFRLDPYANFHAQLRGGRRGLGRSAAVARQ